MRKKKITECIMAVGAILIMAAGVRAQESVEPDAPETELSTEISTEDLTSEEEHYVDTGGAIVEDGASQIIERVTYDAQGLPVSRYYSDPSGQSVILPDKGYAGVTYEYDERGLVSAERYFGTDGERIVLENGVSGYDAKNLNESTKLEQLWLNEKDEPVVNTSTGYAHVIRETDPAGNVISVSFFDENDQPLTQSAGYAVVLREYNDLRQKTRESYLDEEGNPVSLPGTGYAAIEYEYDEQGLVSAERYFGEDGERTTLENGISGFTAVNKDKKTKYEQTWLGTHDEPVVNPDTGYASVRREEDEAGNIFRVSFFDENGDLLLQSDGYAVVVREFDENGRKTKESYLGEDAEPIRINSGYAAIGYEYDENGNITRESYFGEDGNPLRVGGYASVSREYNDQGQVTREVYYNEEGTPRLLPGSGYAGILYEYDDAGNVSRETYLGRDLKPTTAVKGYSSIAMEYNEYGDVTRESYFDKNGDPMILPSAGYASITYDYDWMGLVCEERYYGKDGKRITLSNGTSGYSVINLNSNIKLEEMYLDENDEPVINNKTGYAYVVRNADEAGRIYYVAYYDEDLYPLMMDTGYATVSRDYDENGKVVMESYFDEEGKLTILPGKGYAAISYEYDDQGLVAAERYFGKDGLRTILDNGVSGYKCVNLNRNVVLDETWLDVDESPVMNRKLGYAHVVREVDEDGNITRESYFNADDDPVIMPNGYSSIAWEYNDRRQVTKESYFGKNGDPILLPSSGYAAVSYEYDNKGLVNCERYFGTDGKRITLEDGSSGYKVVYLNKNVKLEEMWLDENDHPVTNLKNGYAHVVRDADEDGLVHYVAFFDEEDKPTKVREGYAAVARDYDDSGKIIKETYYNEDSEMMILPSKGYACVAYEYDEQGLVSAERYFGTDGTRIALGNGISGFTAVNLNKNTKLEEQFIGAEDLPVINKDVGYSHVVREVDDDGNIVHISFFDEDERPIIVKEGYASVAREFNKLRQLTKESYYGREGEAILRLGVGYAAVEYTYDSKGIVNSERYYGTDGKRITLQNGVSGYDAVNLDSTTRLEERWLDPNDLPVYNRDKGYASVIRMANNLGKVIQISFYDEYDTPCTQQEGYAFVTRLYNESGRKIQESYFDRNFVPVVLRSSGYSAISYEYDIQGLVSCERYYSPTGERIVLDSGVSGYSAVNLNKDTKLEETWLDAEDNPVMNTVTGYARVVRTVDELGNVTRISYLDEEGEPVMLKDGYSGVSMKYNSRRQKIRETYLDKNGEPVLASGLGYASVSYEYDQKGRVSAERYYRENGRRVTLSSGISGKKTVYLTDSIKQDELYIDRDDQPVVNRELGYAHVVREVNGMNDIVKVSFYDENDAPVASGSGYACVEREYNALRQKTKESYFNAGGKPVKVPSLGYASVAYTYDDLGLTATERYYGEDGNRIALANGVSGYDIVSLDSSRKLDERWLDENDQPVVNKDKGYAHVVREADKAGNIVRVSFYDEKDEPVMAGSFASVTRDYDLNGNIVYEQYYGVDGNPVPMEDGYYAVGFTYNNQGHKLTERYFDSSGQLTMTKKGYAGIDRTYDGSGNVIREAFLDNHSQYCMTPMGYAIVVSLYDAKNHKTEEAYYNENSYPVYPADRGYTRVKYVYDNEGNITLAHYFDRKQKRRDLGGYSGYRCYWNKGKRAEEAYLNDNDALSMNKEKGYALVYHDYDAAGNEIATRYYDDRRLPVEVNDSAVILRTFDDNGNVTTEKKYDADGSLRINSKGWAWIEKKYNDNGKVAEETFIREDGSPMMVDGYATVQRSFDEAGNVILAAYFDTEGQGVVLPKGYHAIRRENSDNGKIVRTEYLDASGNPVTLSDGYAMTVAELDDAGNTIVEKWYDASGTQVNRKGVSYAAVIRDYNEQNKPVRSVYVDLNDQRVDNSAGYSVVVNDYDDRGNMIYEAYFTKEGFQVMPVDKWYHVVKKVYDENNKPVLESFYGFYNDPILLDGGYAAISMQYNEEGKEIWKGYLGTEGELVINRSGYAQVKTSYPDEQTVRTAYCDVSGNRINCKSGYSAVEKYYDKSGRQTGQAYFDAGDAPAMIGSLKYVRIDFTYAEDGTLTKVYRDISGNIVREETES